MRCFMMLLALWWACVCTALPKGATKDSTSSEVIDGVTYTVFSHAATGARLRFVTNSRICETTPGVNQYSGYMDFGEAHTWFWFFEARKNPANAPIAAWFNGGPGCSSMVGLFTENGPCQFTGNSTTPTLNPYSWNQYANMLYVDQPIGAGFSYGKDGVNSTVTAAPPVWTLLQAFLTRFPKYKSRDFGLFTESYGGHYGPEFAHYIEDRNSAIEAGAIKAEKIKLVALGINNGWYDGALQYRADIEYMHKNWYKVGLLDKKEYAAYKDNFTAGCEPLLSKCALSRTDSDCSRAFDECESGIVDGLVARIPDGYDIRGGPQATDAHEVYLNTPSVRKAIGATTSYEFCGEVPWESFGATGDRARSIMHQLSRVVSSGIRTLIWAGDADFFCNWFGNIAVAEAIDYPGHSRFARNSLQSYTVNGVERGAFKCEGSLCFLQVYQAGHTVPFYTPELALQVFVQTMQRKAIESTHEATAWQVITA